MIVYENKTIPVEVIWNNGVDFVTHVHHALEVVVCLQGTMKVSCRYVTRELQPGEAMVAFSHDVHAYHRTPHGGGVILIVSPSVLSLFASRLNARRYDNFCMTPDPDLIRWGWEAYHMSRENCSTDLLVGYTYLILGKLLQELPYSMGEESVADLDLFTQIMEYLAAHYQQPLMLETVAAHFGISPSHLSRTFGAKLGCGYLDYIHQLRVEHAQEMLSGTDRKISDIAFACGFSDQRSFNRVFKKVTGVTPREYRTSGKGQTIETPM